MTPDEALIRAIVAAVYVVILVCALIGLGCWWKKRNGL